MRARILISLALIASILSVSVGMTQQTQYNMPLKTTYESLSPSAKKQVECLAQNIYYEAGYEPQEGQIAVAFVTINRVKSGNYPGDICGVVKQKIGNTCQFSWFCQVNDDAWGLTKHNNVVYNSVKELATFVYANYERMTDPSKGALFYHADYVNPGWPNMKKTAVIGRHIFYNRKGNTNI